MRPMVNAVDLISFFLCPVSVRKGNIEGWLFRNNGEMINECDSQMHPDTMGYIQHNPTVDFTC